MEDKSVPRVTVWHHSAEPHDAKTVTLWKDLSVRTSHSCQILIIFLYLFYYLNHELTFQKVANSVDQDQTLL